MFDLSRLKTFHAQHYTRHLVLKTPTMEIIVVGWLPGQGSPIHGHGPTEGVVMILEGEIQNTNHFPDGQMVSSAYRQGCLIHTPVGVQHQMRNCSSEPTLTLHIYAPPLEAPYKNPDLGYDNETRIAESQMPENLVPYLMAAIPQSLQEEGIKNYCI